MTITEAISTDERLARMEDQIGALQDEILTLHTFLERLATNLGVDMGLPDRS